MAEQPKAPLSKQISMLMQGLENVHVDRTDARFEQIVKWVADLPAHIRSPELFSMVSRAFSVPEHELMHRMQHKDPREDFELILPKQGWFSDYVKWTRTTEPPTAFHFFVAATILGSVLKRNVFYDRGFAKLFPNICVILVAPSGKCRKTSACELGVKLARESGTKILADKVTPEALVHAYAESAGDATGLIYSGELKQFLGSQKYMEGMIPLLTRLLDCPDVWTSSTIGKGELTLTNVAFSMLGASTMDWLRLLPGDSFGGGFMSRFLLVVQDETPRSFPLPPPMDDGLRGKLTRRLRDLTQIRARYILTPKAEEWYRDWYDKRRGGGEEKFFSGYFERKPDNLFRLGMLLSIAEDDGFVLEVRHLKQALRILDWVESWLPGAFGQLGANLIGEDHIRLVNQLKRANGALKYSDWLRKNSLRMHATQFRNYVSTLREAKLVDFDGGVYYLTPDGWKHGGS